MKNNRSTALHMAAYTGNVPTCRIFMNKGHSVHDMDDNGRTPLHAAAIAGHTYACLTLLEGGACLGILDNTGRTPQDLARAFGYQDTAEELDDWEIASKRKKTLGAIGERMRMLCENSTEQTIKRAQV